MSGPTPIIHHTILLNKEGEREDAVDLDAEQISLVLDRSKKIAAIIRANIGVRKSRVIDETDTCNPKLMRQVLKILYSSDWPSGPALESSYFTRLCRAFQIFECDRSLLQQCKQVNDVREEWKAEYEESNTELDARHEAAMSRVLTALYLDWDDVLHEAASDLILFNRDDASDLESIIPMGSNGRSIEGFRKSAQKRTRGAVYSRLMALEKSLDKRQKKALKGNMAAHGISYLWKDVRSESDRAEDALSPAETMRRLDAILRDMSAERTSEPDEHRPKSLRGPVGLAVALIKLEELLTPDESKKRQIISSLRHHLNSDWKEIRDDISASVTDALTVAWGRRTPRGPGSDRDRIRQPNGSV